MKVRELISRLRGYPPDADVGATCSQCNLGGLIVKIEHVQMVSEDDIIYLMME